MIGIRGGLLGRVGVVPRQLVAGGGGVGMLGVRVGMRHVKLCGLGVYESIKVFRRVSYTLMSNIVLIFFLTKFMLE